MPNCHAVSSAPEMRKQTKKLVGEVEKEREFEKLAEAAINSGLLSEDEVSKIKEKKEPAATKTERLIEACVRQKRVDDAVGQLLTSKKEELSPSEIEKLFMAIESNMSAKSSIPMAQ